MDMDEIIKCLRSLPIEDFKKRFNEMYDPANDNDKEEIIRLFKDGVDKHIEKVDAFIAETTMLLKHDEMLDLQYV